MTDLKIIIGNKNYSSWSLRGWLAVAATGLEYEEILLPLDTEEFYDRIADLNPSGKVPALHHGETLVWDSLAIIDYIAHLHPEKNIWPADNEAYGYARSMSAEMHSGFTAIRTHMPMNMRQTWSGLGVSDDIEAEVRRIEALWTGALATYAGDGDFLFGEAFSGADMMFAPIVSRFKTYGIKVNDSCQFYMDAVLDHPAMKKWVDAALLEDAIVDVDEIDPETKVLGASPD